MPLSRVGSYLTWEEKQLFSYFSWLSLPSRLYFVNIGWTSSAAPIVQNANKQFKHLLSMLGQACTIGLHRSLKIIILNLQFSSTAVYIDVGRSLHKIHSKTIVCCSLIILKNYIHNLHMIGFSDYLIWYYTNKALPKSITKKS